MEEWKPSLKTYCHFDDIISESNIVSLVTSPQLIIRNSFYPLIKRTSSHIKFSGPISLREKSRALENKKEREIKYASRRDSYIYSYYRYLLSKRYESFLDEKKISNVVLAYRSLREEDTNAGKCNIHFARDAFIDIKRYKNCYAVALDIKGFFDNLPHELIKQKWCQLLNDERLPEDHFTIYKSITKYRYVDYYQLMERLGFYGSVKVNGKIKKGFLSSKKQLPKKLCSNADFRAKVCGFNSNYESIVRSNNDSIGIPQGTPISDLIANFCLMDFDCEMDLMSKKYDVVYKRYSDDILLIVPDNLCILKKILDKVGLLLKKNFDNNLKINKSKEVINRFYFDGDKIRIARSHAGEVEDQDICLSHKPFEYLGFSFDGDRVLLRNSTVSRLYRKITFSVRLHIKELAKRYTGYLIDELEGKFNISEFLQKYGRIKNFNNAKGEYENWSFWTYAKRADEVMSVAGLNVGVIKQVSKYKKFVVRKFKQELGQKIK